MTTNVDQAEVGKFDNLASRWWDPAGQLRTLHEINPARLNWIDERTPLKGATVLDVGCGGGILSESMAKRGAKVVGIDMAEASLQVARLHALESEVRVEYRHETAETAAAREAGHYDVVTCLELLEHVPDPGQLVAACFQLVRPGGSCFFSTINRSPRAFALAIVAGEYLFGLLPRGTHEYARFIRPSELIAWGRTAGLSFRELAGMRYNPITRTCRLNDDTGVNYLAWAVRPQA